MNGTISPARTTLSAPGSWKWLRSSWKWLG
jgi:hypothetical protein